MSASLDVIKRARLTSRVPPRCSPCCVLGPRRQPAVVLAHPALVYALSSRTHMSKRSCRVTQTRVATAETQLTTTSPTSQALARSDIVHYLFVVPEYVSDFGQELKVVGSLPELGGWNAHAAPSMSWCNGHRWRLDVILPKSAFEFKVVMMHGNHVRWEQGINRVIQPDANSQSHLRGHSSEPVEVIIKVNCHFNNPGNTELAVMVPLKRMQEAFEVAQAALEMLEVRKKKLQREIEKTETAASRAQELNAMTEAVQGQSTTVAMMSEVLEKSQHDPEGCASMPIARISFPAGASLGSLPKLAAASFLPPEQAAAALRTLPSGIDTFHTSPPPTPQAVPAAAAAPPSDAHPPPPSSTPSSSLDLPELRARQESQAKAAQELDSVCQRLQDYFQRHPTLSGATPTNGNGGAATDGRLEGAAQEEVRELAALMSEAEDAWRVARSLSSFEEEEEDEDEVVYRFEESGLQEELGEAAAIQSFARDQLALRMAAAAAGETETEDSAAAATPPPAVVPSASSAPRGLPADSPSRSDEQASQGPAAELAAGPSVAPEAAGARLHARPDAAPVDAGPARADADAVAAAAEHRGEQQVQAAAAGPAVVERGSEAGHAAGAAVPEPEQQQPAVAVEAAQQQQQLQEAVGGVKTEQQPAVAAVDAEQQQQQQQVDATKAEQQQPVVTAGKTEQQQQQPVVAAGETEQQQQPAVAGKTEQQQQQPAVAGKTEQQQQQQQQQPVVAAAKTEQQQQQPVVAGKTEQQQQQPAVAAGKTEQQQLAVAAGETEQQQQPAAAAMKTEQQLQPAVAAGETEQQQQQQLAVAAGETREQQQQQQQQETVGGAKAEQQQQQPAVAAVETEQQQQQQLAAASTMETGPTVAAKEGAHAPAPVVAERARVPAEGVSEELAEPPEAMVDEKATGTVLFARGIPVPHAETEAAAFFADEPMPAPLATDAGLSEMAGERASGAKEPTEPERQPVAAEAERQALAGKAEQQAMAGKEEQQAIAGKEVQQAVAGKEEQQAMAGKEEQQGVAGEAERQAIAGEAEQQAIAGKAEQKAVAGEVQQHRPGGLETTEEQQQQQTAQHPELILLLSGTPDVKVHGNGDAETRRSAPGFAPSEMHPGDADNQAEEFSSPRSFAGAAGGRQGTAEAEAAEEEPRGTVVRTLPARDTEAAAVQREGRAPLAQSAPVQEQAEPEAMLVEDQHASAEEAEEQAQQEAEQQQRQPDPGSNLFERFWNFFKP